MAPEKTAEFKIGDVIAGKYRIDKIIGEGGMGVVAAATHLELRDLVALKFLRKEVIANKPLVARFANEARAAVKLKSEHVARTIDVGATAEGVPFIVMEYLSGQDLGEVLDKKNVLPVTLTIEYMIQACEALAEAHARGIVHQDIKPANIFLVERDGLQYVKVLDFGISKAALAGTTAEELKAMETGELMGSPTYMSPEQLKSGGEIDRRADVWSMGVLMFELLTGQTPFDSHLPLPELLGKILSDPLRKVRSLRPEVPEEIEKAILRCLEKDKTKRFQNTAEFALALLPFAPRRSRVVVERAISVAKSAGFGDSTLELPPSMIPPSMPASASGAVPPHVLKNATPIGVSSDVAQSSKGKSPPWLVMGAAAAGLIAVALIATKGTPDKVSPASVAVAKDDPKTTAPPTPQPVEAEAVPASSAKAAVPDILQVHIESVPPGARVTEKEVELCAATPCIVTYKGASSTEDHLVTLRRVGFQSGTGTVPRDGTPLKIVLQKGTPKAVEAKPAGPVAPGQNLSGFKETPY